MYLCILMVPKHPLHPELDEVLADKFPKTGQNCSSGTDSITGKFLLKMTCVLPSISQPNIAQIQLSGTVLESSGRADSKTVIGFQI